MSDEQKAMDADVAMVKRHCEQMVEHFDSVQIFCTRHDPDSGGTIRVQIGQGNWFARYGHVKNWILGEEHGAATGTDTVEPDEK